MPKFLTLGFKLPEAYKTAQERHNIGSTLARRLEEYLLNSWLDQGEDVYVTFDIHDEHGLSEGPDDDR